MERASVCRDESNPFQSSTEDVRILSVDRLTVEKIVLEKGGSREILLTKSESTKKISNKITKIPTAKVRSSLWRRKSSSTDELSSSRIQRFKLINGLDLSLTADGGVINSAKTLPRTLRSDSVTSLNEKRTSPVKLTKIGSIGSLARFNKTGKALNLGKVRKIPPKVPAKPKKKNPTDLLPNSETQAEETIDISKNLDNNTSPPEVLKSARNEREKPQKNGNSATKAHEILVKSQSEIQRLQQNLQTQINATTAQTYKEKLPSIQLSSLRVIAIPDLDLNENVTKKTSFDKDFLEKHNYDTELKIEEKHFSESENKRLKDIEKSENREKPRYSKKVEEIEKRWSGEFLEANFEHNSSESSYVEELGSISSRESINADTEKQVCGANAPFKYEKRIEDSRKQSHEEIFEETVSTLDSDSCLEDRINAIDDDIGDSLKLTDCDEEIRSRNDPQSNDSTLKDSVKSFISAENTVGESASKDFRDVAESLEKDAERKDDADDCLTDDKAKKSERKGSTSPDGYASLIKEFTMDAGSSRSPKEEKKKKSGLRRLLPGIFSPKDSRKDYKREQKERKKRDEKHFNQYQQNGIYTRSPDSMNLNDDISRNVKLDSSLNSSIIEERLNEIKQELFPEQGMTTSTPDHFFENDPTLAQDPCAARSYMVNTSMSSIAHDEKWLDHNIISGSPDMRKFKQQMHNDNDRKCSLERKHSLQESQQPRFLRNHGPSGRISAPPAERFLIRPRAVHPVDRPLPAIPQKIEFTNYANQEETQRHGNYFRRNRRTDVPPSNYPMHSYNQAAINENYSNDPSLYENGNRPNEKMEINRNQSIDSGFNLTPVSAQAKMPRQFVSNHSQKLTGRSPKYSPSLSQKSGDYADSTYTPNSSQKSEFSPGSSKSGEYYLNSPRNSSRTSPDSSFSERKDQLMIYDQQHESNLNREQPVPYPVSPKITIQSKEECVYDVSQISPLQEIRVDKLSPSPRQLTVQTGAAQDSNYAAQRGSPNIPMSTNLAKLRANVENTKGTGSSVCAERLSNDNGGQTSSRVTSPVPSSRILASPVQFRDSLDKVQPSSVENLPRVMSPSRIQRMASPLTIVTTGNSSPIPHASSTNAASSSANSRSVTSPRVHQNSQQGNQTLSQSRTTPSSGAYTPMVSFNSRRATQPNEQILIASPKREGSIYETQRDRLAATMESGCPDSPVPMSESPCPVAVPRLQNVPKKLIERGKSPNSEVSIRKDEGRALDHSSHRASPIVRAMSPMSESQTSKNIQRPEPIYIRQHPSERALSPMPEDHRVRSPVAISGEQRADNLLMQVQTCNDMQNRVSSPDQRQQQDDLRDVESEYDSGKPLAKERIYVERRRVRSPSGNSRTNSHRPEVIYVQGDRNLFNSNVQSRKEYDSSVGSPRGVDQLQEQSQSDPRRIQRENDNIYEARNKVDGQCNQRQDIVVAHNNAGMQLTRSPQQQQRQQQIYASRQENLSENQRQPIANRQSARKDPVYVDRRSLRQQEPIYAQRTSDPIYGQQQSRQLSPSKRQMMQHLEAFYWQQKALDAHRKPTDCPTKTNSIITEGKMESPEIREALYWQQLKKLDEEQQRRIFEENQMDERSDPIYWKKKIHGSASSPSAGNSARQPLAPIQANQSPSLLPIHQRDQKILHDSNAEQIYWQNKSQKTKSQIPVGKPPMMGQKGQNQPVLIVRPQQAVRDSDILNRSAPYDQRDGEILRQEVPRSKSVSPHLNRGDERRSLSLPRKSGMLNDDSTASLKTNRDANARNNTYSLRKSSTSPIYDIAPCENTKKAIAPTPIFKRGSLISNSSSSVEYGTMGTKRVSFSNQANSPEVGSGNWPTKHGMAPEPPTRKHRTEERPGANPENIDSTFIQVDEQSLSNPTNVCDSAGKMMSDENVPSDNRLPVTEQQQQQRSLIYEAEYDAKPLPPPPRDPSWMLKRSSSMRDQSSNAGRISTVNVQRAKVPANPRKWPGVSESESGSEAGEVQRILVRRNEEEWNSGGKGRQSNDTGGPGRGEGEGGPNDLVGGWRGGRGVVSGGGPGSGTSGSGGGGGGGIGGRSRDEPRRHTLSGDHQPSLHHQQFNLQQLHPLHPHHLPPIHGQYGTAPNRHTTMDLEMGTKSRQRKSPFPRGYPPSSSAMLFDDDPGIMSEVETSSTGFRRGGKQRSSLPVVRTPSKTLERPLGLVFLQYRSETKRALLPNEITSIDTVKALFVRSFPKQLTMEYLDSPHVKVYIHDSSKNMFYELEDLRSHLRDIRDRSVLRLFESTDGVAGMPGPMGAPSGGIGLPAHWEDQSYFSEPEFDSDFQHQHIHKSKTSKHSSSGSGGYYIGGSSTLPRGGSLMRAYSPANSSIVAGPNATPTQPKSLGTPGGGGVAPAKPLRSYQCGKSPLGSLGGSARFSRDSSVSLYSIPDRLHGESGYMSSPERGGGVGTGSGRYPGGPYSTGSSYEEPYYSQYSGTVTPVIDEEASDTELLEESYTRYGVKPPVRPPSGPPRSPFPPGAPALPPGQPYDVTRIRVEQMERQLANLTGLVQKALTHAPHTSPSPRDYLQVPAGRDPYTRTTGAGDEFDKHSSSSSASLPDDPYLRTDVKPPKLGKDKSVSFEKSVSFSDEPPDMNSPKQHSPQHAADTKPTKPAIKSSTLPRMSSQERDRHKPTPPPKPATLAAGQYVYRDLALTPEMYNQLRGLQKKAKDLRQEVRNLRRMSQAQAHTVRETIRDTFITIRAMLLSGGEAAWAAGDAEKMRLSREEDLYKQEMIRLEKDLTELESTVEELRGNVINRKTRVNMSDVENMALILSKSSKTVADLKVRFPGLQEGMKGLLSSEMEKVVREEKFLKEEPERLESALRRCKKLTGTLVTLKRLASVQEQRSPNAASVDAEETPPITPTSAQHSKTATPVPAERTILGSTGVVGGGSHACESSAPNQQRPENALDALLDELQTFSRPGSQMSQASGMAMSSNHVSSLSEIGRSASQTVQSGGRAPCMSEIGRKGSVDSSTSLAIVTPSPGHPTNTLRRLHSYPSSSDTDTSPPIARLQISDSGAILPPQKPPVPERNAELLQLATARRVPPPPPPRTSSRSPLASPTSPQLPPRNPTGTLRRGRPANAKESGKPPMALPPNSGSSEDSSAPPMANNNNTNNILSASNSSSCESINSQEGLQNKKGRQEQLEQRHQELLRKQKALQEQYARLQQLQRNASGLTTVPPAPPDLLKKTGSESNLLAKMGLGLSTTSSGGSLTSLTTPKNTSNSDGQPLNSNQQPVQQENAQANQQVLDSNKLPGPIATGQTTTTSKIYETDIL